MPTGRRGAHRGPTFVRGAASLTNIDASSSSEHRSMDLTNSPPHRRRRVDTHNDDLMNGVTTTTTTIATSSNSNRNRHQQQLARGAASLTNIDATQLATSSNSNTTNPSVSMSVMHDMGSPKSNIRHTNIFYLFTRHIFCLPFVHLLM